MRWKTSSRSLPFHPSGTLTTQRYRAKPSCLAILASSASFHEAGTLSIVQASDSAGGAMRVRANPKPSAATAKARTAFMEASPEQLESETTAAPAWGRETDRDHGVLSPLSKGLTPLHCG